MNYKTRETLIVTISIILVLIAILGIFGLIALAFEEDSLKDIPVQQFCASQGYWHGEYWGDGRGLCDNGSFDKVKVVLDGANWRIVND